jgi:Txe/YoeB family toxin of toxin-antitoxin system
MVEWELVFTRQAIIDSKKIKNAGLKNKVQHLLDILHQNPYQTPPLFEKLTGDLKGAFSRRINSKHRLVYQPLDDVKIVKILRMWTHYE